MSASDFRLLSEQHRYALYAEAMRELAAMTECYRTEVRAKMLRSETAAPEAHALDAEDARRYRYLRERGAALAGSYHQKEGLVRRFGNLDEEIDRELCGLPQPDEPKK